MANIKFISYDGTYPTLCSGKLVVEIDDKVVSFGKTKKFWSWDTEDSLADYLQFWCSGGSTGFDDDGEYTIPLCPWEMSEGVNEKNYPPEIWKLLPDILNVMNDNVPGGCCGGCL